ncbi:hypothetical protein K2Y11_05555 [bacterium]|nr:hypothetical protein [bacterium]
MRASKLLLIVRGFVGLSLAILFWWFVGTHLTIPAWQVAVLPAAVVGYMSAYGETRWGTILYATVIMGGVFSAIAGEWLHVYGRLVEAHDRSLNINIEESLLAAVAKHQAEMEKSGPTDSALEVKPPTSKGLPKVDLLSAGQIAFDRALREWQGPVLSIVLSLFAAGQAARMTMQWKQSPRQE